MVKLHSKNAMINRIKSIPLVQDKYNIENKIKEKRTRPTTSTIMNKYYGRQNLNLVTFEGGESNRGVNGNLQRAGSVSLRDGVGVKDNKEKEKEKAFIEIPKDRMSNFDVFIFFS